MELVIEPGQSLGLMIRGGVEYGLGIYVTGVDKDSVADRAGLSVSCSRLHFTYSHKTALIMYLGGRSDIGSQWTIIHECIPRRGRESI